MGNPMCWGQVLGKQANGWGGKKVLLLDISLCGLLALTLAFVACFH